MNLEKNKIAVIGHSRGIGKAICDLYNKKKYNVVGMSKSNGFDLVHDQEKILEKIQDCGLVVAAQDVDQAGVDRIGTTPNSATSDFIEICRAQTPGLTNLAGEIGVDEVEHSVEPLRLPQVEGLSWGERYNLGNLAGR